MPAVAVIVTTLLQALPERQGLQPDNRRVPGDVVRAPHEAMVQH